MRAYWEVTDNTGTKHYLSCGCSRWGFNQDTALGYVLRNYFAEPNHGIQSLNYLGKFSG